MSVLKGDYIGFSYNGKHSSDLGIARVSDGSRFNENLLPSMQDKTVQVPGGDGSYYFGSQYAPQQFSISFAFDSLTEGQLQELKRVFGDKKVHPLIFDEIPYKIYQAKVTSSATIKYIAFEEGKTNRVYKGEGSLQFTVFQTYARVKYKFLTQYSRAEQMLAEEWNDAARLLESQGNFDIRSNNQIPIYNPGDIEADFVFSIRFINGKIPATKLSLNLANDTERQLALNEMIAQGSDVEVKIDTKANLIEGYDSSGKKTGNIYNRYIKAGFFFKLPISIETSNPPYLVIDNSKGIISNLSNAPLEYYYYYF